MALGSCVAWCWLVTGEHLCLHLAQALLCAEVYAIIAYTNQPMCLNNVVFYLHDLHVVLNIVNDVIFTWIFGTLSTFWDPHWKLEHLWIPPQYPKSL